MKARLYRATGEARNYVDGYSLYLPYPKWLVKYENVRYGLGSDNIIGTFLGCSPASNGTMIRCCWEDFQTSKYGPSPTCLGRRVDINLMPDEFRKECQRIESLWDEACKTRNFSRWNEEA